jgi:DNA-binding transcriptional regulator LsrR (DeoR family)
MAKRMLTDDEIKWAYEKWCDGYTQQQIADALYVSRVTVYNYLKDKQRIRPALHYERRCDNG